MSTLEIILGAYSLVVSVLAVFIMRSWWRLLCKWEEALYGWRKTLDLLEAGEWR